MKNKIGLRTRIRRLSPAIAVEKQSDSFSETAVEILKIDNFFNKEFEAPALRPAARLLLYIMVKRSVSIKQAMLDSQLSYRAFYIMIDRLKNAAYLGVENDSADRRVRRLVLGKEFDRIMKKMPAFLEKDEIEIIR